MPHLDLLCQICIVLVGSLKALLVKVTVLRLRGNRLPPPQAAVAGLQHELQPWFRCSLAGEVMSGGSALEE
jgi:hypothetical protein